MHDKHNSKTQSFPFLRLERRIMRRYRDVAPEEVLALRRSVARQLEDIQRCKAKAQR